MTVSADDVGWAVPYIIALHAGPPVRPDWWCGQCGDDWCPLLTWALRVLYGQRPDPLADIADPIAATVQAAAKAQFLAGGSAGAAEPITRAVAEVDAGRLP